MKQFIRKFILTVYLFQTLAVPIKSETTPLEENSIPKLLDVRAEGDQVVIELSQLLPYKTTTLTSPWRLIIESPGALYQAGFSKKNLDSPLVKRVRGYQSKEPPLISRVVMD